MIEVIGDVMLDIYETVSVDRISPEAPVPVCRRISKKLIPGGAANVACNLASLGASVSLKGIVGADINGQILSKKISETGTIVNLKQIEGFQTVAKTRIVSNGHQLLRIDDEINCEIDHNWELSVDCSVLVVSDYNKGSVNDISNLMAEARVKNIFTIVDPKGLDWEKYRNASLIKPNQSEFFDVVGECKSEQEILNKSILLIKKLNLKALLITRSELGMTLITHEGQRHHVDALAQDVIDVTGAGDTVAAVLAFSIAQGMTLYKACEQANLAASKVVQRAGTSVIKKTDLNDISRIKKTKVIDNKKDLAELIKAIRQDKIVVFTNGCFDLLHAGHVDYLEQAKLQGDLLIVGVNSDNSVKKQKGANRPINCIGERLRVLSGLNSVDILIEFDEDTPKNLLSIIKPDVLVKGGDYDYLNQVVGHEIVESYSGKVMLIKKKFDTSTTATLLRAK